MIDGGLVLLLFEGEIHPTRPVPHATIGVLYFVEEFDVLAD